MELDLGWRVVSRKTLYYTVSDEGRDQGKTYLITEMPASRAEMWAARAFLAMANHSVDVPASLINSGMAGLSGSGLALLGKLPFAEAEPLLAEMMECVMFVPDPGKRDFTRTLVENDIEEIKTRLKLRLEILKLHADFFKAVAPSNSAAPGAAAA